MEVQEFNESTIKDFKMIHFNHYKLLVKNLEISEQEII